MSLILDALQRSQEQPSATPVSLTMTSEAASAGKGRSGVIVGIVLGMVATLVVWLLLERYAPWQASVDIGSSAGSMSGSVEAMSFPTAQQVPATTTPEPSVDVANTSLSSPAQTPVRDKEVGALYESIQIEGSGSEAVIEAAAGQDQIDKQNLPEEQDDKSIDIEALLRKAQAHMGEASLTAHRVPLIDRLSQQQKDRIPTLLYTEHSWSAESASVVINGQRLLAGGRLNGLAVVEVLDDSVILSWSGIEFRLAALNSWVNL